ncbi:MAG: DUF445 family protein [Blastocatellia bacterium]|nr:DUF445 family protein [Blastocatellia bacterium]
MNTDLLVKLSPMLVATLHGYGAAWLAVKMLFRPRHPIYIGKWRLPLTPGMLPKERDHFIEALSSVIAERLLDVETITDEIMKLNLESEITSIARREYLHHSQSDTTIGVIAEHLRDRLLTLRDTVETRWEITRALRRIVEAEMARRFNLLQRLVGDYILSDEALYRIVGDSIDKLAEQISESLYVRTTISQLMAQLPETIFQGGQGGQGGQPGAPTRTAPISDFVTVLSQRLDFRTILINRLSALSNEAIEQLIMDTAGREISAIVWFGAGIGFVVGVFQTLINFL